MIDGYFVHFTEDDPKLEALPKYTVFVLDVSLISLPRFILTLSRGGMYRVDQASLKAASH